jgi:hypothetical protein
MKRKKKFAASLFTKRFNMEAAPRYGELSRQHPGGVDHVSYPCKHRAKLEDYVSTPIVPSPPADTLAN